MKNLLMLTIVLFTSCGKGSKGNPGNDGSPSEYVSRNVDISSDCSVNTSPNCNTNNVVNFGEVESSDFSVVVPAFLEIDNAPIASSGNNGYITLKVGSLIYCFQRKNQNSSDPILRRRHDLVGMKFSGTCSTGVDSTIIRTELSVDDEGKRIEATVHGPFTVSVPTTFTLDISLEIKSIQ